MWSRKKVQSTVACFSNFICQNIYWVLPVIKVPQCILFKWQGHLLYSYYLTETKSFGWSWSPDFEIFALYGYNYFGHHHCPWESILVLYSMQSISHYPECKCHFNLLRTSWPSKASAELHAKLLCLLRFGMHLERFRKLLSILTHFGDLGYA